MAKRYAIKETDRQILKDMRAQIEGGTSRGDSLSRFGRVNLNSPERNRGVSGRRPILAKITGAGAATGYYTALEVYPDGTAVTDGLTWDTAGSGLHDDLFCVSDISETVATDTIVQVHYTGDQYGNQMWYFVRHAAYQLFPVTLAYNAGSDGTWATTPTYASWTYDVTDLNGVSLGTNVSVEKSRYLPGPMTKATKGICYYNAAGTLVIWDTNEYPSAFKECT